MPKEIELKFLIRNGADVYPTEELLKLYPSVGHLKADVINRGMNIHQGYLPLNIGNGVASILNWNIDFSPVEARLRSRAEKYFFTLKGEGNLLRDEMESEIDKNVFYKFWPDTSGKRIEKHRLVRPHEGLNIEFDVYRNRDLIVAEIEFPDLDSVKRVKPLGKDVTNDTRYKNRNLAN